MSNYTYRQILKRIFSHEAIIVIIKGYWKTGKTNVGLRLYEDLLSMGLIKLAGTNIKITSSDTLKYVEDFDALKAFHYDHPKRPKPKLFIFDEAGKIAVKRGAMRTINVEWMKFLPELSKGKMKLLVITQSEFLTDSMFTDTEFTRATITTHKSREFGYSISIDSELLSKGSKIYINNFPETNIPYSPYQSAEFFLEPRTPETLDLLCCEIAKMYAIEKLSTTKIGLQKGWSRDKVIRYIKMHIRHTFGRLTPDDLDEIRGKSPQEPPDELKSSPVSEIPQV